MPMVLTIIDTKLAQNLAAAKCPENHHYGTI